MSYPILKTRIVKPKKRVARGAGSGCGGTSGRGHKGQKARTGHKKKLFFEGGAIPLYRRLPKVGGFKRHWADKPFSINIRDLAVFKSDETVDLSSLKTKKLIPSSATSFKILSLGEINQSLTISGGKFSVSAKTKLEKAGCKFIADENQPVAPQSDRKKAKKNPKTKK